MGVFLIIRYRGVLKEDGIDFVWEYKEIFSWRGYLLSRIVWVENFGDIFGEVKLLWLV